MRSTTQQSNAAQQNGGRPQGSDQQGQMLPAVTQGPRAQHDQQGQPAQSSQPGLQNQQQSQAPHSNQPGAQNTLNRGKLNFSPKVIEQVKRFQWDVPIAIQSQGPQVASKYLQETKMKYAQILQNFETVSEKFDKLEKAVFARKQNNQFNPNDEPQYQEQRQALQGQRDEARSHIQQFMHDQNQITGQNAAGGGTARVGGDQMKREPSQNGGVPANTTQTQQTRPHTTVSSALDAARSHSDASDSAKAAATLGQNTAATNNQIADSQKPAQSQPPPTQPQSVKTGQRPPDQRINTTQPTAPSQTQTAGQAYPLSHEAAMQQARSYSNPNNQYPHGAPPNAPHPHTQQQRLGGTNEQQNMGSHSKMFVPKELSVGTPQPVQMGQSRPTLTNGPLAPGPIGQPAMSRHPGYVLEGDGERVLSKKKLEELVRQVTSSTVGEGDDGETMTAEVEEVSFESDLTLKELVSKQR